MSRLPAVQRFKAKQKVPGTEVTHLEVVIKEVEDMMVIKQVRALYEINFLNIKVSDEN